MRFQVDTIIRKSSVLLRTSMFSSPSSPSSLNLWHPRQCTREVISLRWPSGLTLESLKQKSSAPLPNLSKDQAGRVTWQVLTRGTPFGPQLWSSCQAGTRKAEGSAALPSGTDPRTGQRAPTPEPGEGRRPKNRQSQRRKVFLPGCSVFSLSWPACAWSLLVPVRWFSGPAPSGSSLFWFRLMFLSIGRGRRVPAPSGRDVGSSAVAPTQEPAQGADPRTGFCRYPSAYGFVVYLVAPGLSFPLHFAILFWRSWHSSIHTANVPVFTRKPEDSFLAQ